jgi:hypothetical protein
VLVKEVMWRFTYFISVVLLAWVDNFAMHMQRVNILYIGKEAAVLYII